MIILHYTGMLSAEAALERLCNPDSGVSCHYFVDEDGKTTQLVAEKQRAWHAGKSCWQGDGDINSRSIGIEIVNPGHEYGYCDFPPAQIAAVIELCLDCAHRLQVPDRNILAHSDVAPSRKADPGERFPWHQLHEAGIGLWVETAPVSDGPCSRPGDVGDPVAALQDMLEKFGYCLESTGIYDQLTQEAVVAFQRHYRPQIFDGIADPATINTLQRLLDVKADPASGSGV